MPLSDTLSNMLTQAAQTGQPQERSLQRGLRLHVKIVNGKTSIGISRAETMPGMNEWRTVMHALPYTIKIEHPASGLNKKGRYVLYAEWPTPEQEQAL